MKLSKKLLKEVERLTEVSNNHGYWSTEIQEQSKTLANKFSVSDIHLIHSLVKQNTTNLGGNL